MKIRNVEEADLSELAPLSCVVNKMHVDAYPDIYQKLSVEVTINFLALKLNDNSVIFRLAEKESKTLGYYFADIREIDETDLFKAFRFIYLAEIMVSPESRSSGVGKALLVSLINSSNNFSPGRSPVILISANESRSELRKMCLYSRIGIHHQDRF